MADPPALSLGLRSLGAPIRMSTLECGQAATCGQAAHKLGRGRKPGRHLHCISHQSPDGPVARFFFNADRIQRGLGLLFEALTVSTLTTARIKPHSMSFSIREAEKLALAVSHCASRPATPVTLQQVFSRSNCTRAPVAAGLVALPGICFAAYSERALCRPWHSADTLKFTDWSLRSFCRAYAPMHPPQPSSA